MSAGGVRRITSSPSSQTSRRSSPAPCSSTSPASGTYQKPVQRALKNRRGRSGSSFRKSRVMAAPTSSRSGVPLRPTSGKTCRRTPVRSAALELRKNNRTVSPAAAPRQAPAKPRSLRRSSRGRRSPTGTDRAMETGLSSAFATIQPAALRFPDGVCRTSLRLYCLDDLRLGPAGAEADVPDTFQSRLCHKPFDRRHLGRSPEQVMRSVAANCRHRAVAVPVGGRNGHRPVAVEGDEEGAGR